MRVACRAWRWMRRGRRDGDGRAPIMHRSLRTATTVFSFPPRSAAALRRAEPRRVRSALPPLALRYTYHSTAEKETQNPNRE